MVSIQKQIVTETLGIVAASLRHCTESLSVVNQQQKLGEWSERVSACRNSAAWQGFDYCNQLFAIEQELADKSATTRYEERQKMAKPVLDAMLSWANSRAAAPNSALGKALHYLKNQWPYLLNYLKDGRLEISNNRAERSIKPFVIDRKNFLFANTPGGAQGSAVIFSLIQTSIENGLDPWRYLTWVIDKAAKGGVDADGLFPWVAPDLCRVST